MSNPTGKISRWLSSTILKPEFGLQFRVFGVAIFLFLLFYFVASFGAFAADVRVIDGDTIVVDGEHFRIKDLDAPEIMHRKCPEERVLGKQAKAFVEGFLRGKELIIDRTGKKSRNRPVVRVYVDGERLANAVIDAGYGVWWTGKKHDWCS